MKLNKDVLTNIAGGLAASGYALDKYLETNDPSDPRFLVGLVVAVALGLWSWWTNKPTAVPPAVPKA